MKSRVRFAPSPTGPLHIGGVRTAPKYAGLDKVNPLSLILSAEMMLRHINWNEAADLLINSIEKTIQDKYVTYDFERLMDNASLVSCSGFAEEMIKRM